MLYKEKVIDGQLHYATHADEWKPVTAEVLTIRLLQAYDDLYYCEEGKSMYKRMADTGLKHMQADDLFKKEIRKIVEHCRDDSPPVAVVADMLVAALDIWLKELERLKELPSLDWEIEMKCGLVQNMDQVKSMFVEKI